MAHKLESVVTVAIEVSRTSLVVIGEMVGSIGPFVFGTVTTGLFTVVGPSPLLGASTMDACGVDVGEVVAPVGGIGAVGTTAAGVGTVGKNGGIIVGELGCSTDDGAVAGETLASH